ncbi:MAG TPA: YhjD/YihY/BrkB family envelope integrity protein [Pilimelia sp.]|nr:YhjD/YihY/BrkB family envelope integrity protein [Pilimelia sp.]
MTDAVLRRAAVVARHAGASFPVRVLRRFTAINGRDRALVIGGQAFTTLIPFFIVVAAATRQSGSSIVADRLKQRFRLTGASAEALDSLFQRPPGATGAITLAGVVLLLVSLLSLTRSMQRAFETAWRLPPAGLRGTLDGLTGFGLLIASLLVLSLLVSALRPLPAGTVLAAVLRGLAASGVWLVLQYLLLSRRIPVRRLVLGALVAGIGQTLVSLYSALWMPRVIEENANRYGVIGVTFALVSWLIVVGFAIVVSAVVSAEAGGAEPLDAGRPPRWLARLSPFAGTGTSAPADVGTSAPAGGGTSAPAGGGTSAPAGAADDQTRDT